MSGRSRACVVVALTAAVATALAGCGGGGSSTSHAASTAAADSSATLTYGAVQPLTTFDPAQASAGADQALYIAMVYDTLVGNDGKGNPVADLATSWTQDTPLQYTFHLRSGATFQDGSPLTATAVKQSIDRSRAANGPRTSSLAPISAVDAVDPTTVRITVKTPDPDLLPTLASAPCAILSPTAFNRPDLNVNPDGSGPYVYDAGQSVQGDHYTFSVNPHWWNTTIPRPHTVVFKVLTDDTARLNALKTGQIDLATITAAQADQAKRSGLKVASQPNTWEGMMILDRQGKTVPALGNIKVRQAVAYALNRPSLVSALAYGYATASDQVFGKGTLGYDPALEGAYAYNQKKAKQLIAQSGFTNISFTAPIAATQQTAYEAVKAELAAVGINMQLQVEPPNSLGPLGRTTKYPVLTFPLPNQDPYGRYRALWSPISGFNPFHVDDATLDQLASQFAAATTPADQSRLARAMNDEVINQGIVVVATQPDDLAAYSPKLKGVTMSTYLVPRIIGAHF